MFATLIIIIFILITMKPDVACCLECSRRRWWHRFGFRRSTQPRNHAGVWFVDADKAGFVLDLDDDVWRSRKVAKMTQIFRRSGKVTQTTQIVSTQG